MKSSLFKSIFAILGLVAMAALILVFGSSLIVQRMNRPTQQFSPGEPKLFADIIGRAADPVEEVRRLNSIAGEDSFFSFEIYDVNGKSLVSDRVLQVQPEEEGRPGPRAWVTSLSDGRQIEVSMRPPRRGGGGPPPPGLRGTFLITLGLSALASALFGSVILLLAFRSKANEAREVITRLQHGDLKARFPSSRIHEISELLTSFNRMADEIERLVSGIRSEGVKNTHLLQELAHDLRTPLASMMNSLESLQMGVNDPAERELLFNYCLQEVAYTSKLVEDLLLLAQLIEPKYQESTAPVRLFPLLNEELSKKQHLNPEIKVEMMPSERDIDVVVGNSHLLTRLLRNSIENAFEHTHSLVRVSMKKNNGHLEIHIEDDGPGMTVEQLEQFGHKRSTRYFVESEREGGKPKKVSVGLGSVIMKSIAHQHGGTVHMISKTRSSEGSGAILIISLPL